MHRRGERQMAEQVEWVGVGLIHDRGQMLHEDAALFQRLDNLLPLVGVRPLATQVVGVVGEGAHLLAGIVGQLDRAQPAPAGVQFMHRLVDDLDRNA